MQIFASCDYHSLSELAFHPFSKMQLSWKMKVKHKFGIISLLEFVVCPHYSFASLYVAPWLPSITCIPYVHVLQYFNSGSRGTHIQEFLRQQKKSSTNAQDRCTNKKLV